MTKRTPLPTRDELVDLHEQVICRVDAGESVEAAIEAVTGWGKGQLFNAVYTFTTGQPHPDKTRR